MIVGDFPVEDGVYVCVPTDRHASSFSDQWDRWATVQVDSHGYKCGYAGFKDSAEIFVLKTGLTAADLGGRDVLDGGCGTGRFSEVAASFGAKSVTAVDLSRAVFHAAKLGRTWFCERTFLQADLEHLPLPDDCVDIVFSIGVLHHTPEPAKAVREIARVLRPGGTFVGWVYARQPSYDHPLRKVWRDFSSDAANLGTILKLAQEAPRLRDLYDVAKQPEQAVAEAIKILPFLSRLCPDMNPGVFRAVVGISGSRNDDECRLDSFDWMTPKYQWQYTWDEWETILKGAGFKNATPREFPVSWHTQRES